MLGDVLDFARIDRGDIQVHEEVFDLKTAVEVAIRGIDATMARCILSIPDNACWLRGDPGKIGQIVTNLVSNALK
jgi:signal transduction histidine kinase